MHPSSKYLISDPHYPRYMITLRDAIQFPYEIIGYDVRQGTMGANTFNYLFIDAISQDGITTVYM